MPRMQILTPAEHVKFDTLPHFHSVERKRFFDLSHSLDPLLASFRTPTNQMCFVLTLGYFSLKHYWRFVDLEALELQALS
jgi:hypothetical protein